VNQHPAFVGCVGLHPDVELPDVLLRQEGEHTPLQLACSLPGDDLDDVDSGCRSPEDRLPQRKLDVAVAAEDRV
jgi:hypothetical protein